MFIQPSGSLLYREDNLGLISDIGISLRFFRAPVYQRSSFNVAITIVTSSAPESTSADIIPKNVTNLREVVSVPV